MGKKTCQIKYRNNFPKISILRLIWLTFQFSFFTFLFIYSNNRNFIVKILKPTQIFKKLSSKDHIFYVQYQVGSLPFYF